MTADCQLVSIGTGKLAHPIYDENSKLELHDDTINDYVQTPPVIPALNPSRVSARYNSEERDLNSEEKDYSDKISDEQNVNEGKMQAKENAPIGKHNLPENPNKDNKDSSSTPKRLRLDPNFMKEYYETYSMNPTQYGFPSVIFSTNVITRAIRTKCSKGRKFIGKENLNSAGVMICFILTLTTVIIEDVREKYHRIKREREGKHPNCEEKHHNSDVVSGDSDIYIDKLSYNIFKLAINSFKFP